MASSQSQNRQTLVGLRTSDINRKFRSFFRKVFKRSARDDKNVEFCELTDENWHKFFPQPKVLNRRSRILATAKRAFDNITNFIGESTDTSADDSDDETSNICFFSRFEGFMFGKFNYF